MVSSSSSSCDTKRQGSTDSKIISWADLADEDSSKAYGLRLSYSKWHAPPPCSNVPDEISATSPAPTGDSLAREVQQGLQSLEHGSNLDVTSLLVKKKRRSVLTGARVAQRVSPDLTQTQPPALVGPPPGLGDDVPDHEAIDALVDTLSKVLSRSLCQTAGNKPLDLWPPEEEETPAEVKRAASPVARDVVSDEQLSTHCPSQPLTQSCSQLPGPSPSPPGGGDGVSAAAAAPYLLRPQGGVSVSEDGGAWPGCGETASLPRMMPRSSSLPLCPPGLAPSHFFPARSPFVSSGWEDQCLVGGFPITEWRRFFVFLATMDTAALVTYLSNQSAASSMWCVGGEAAAWQPSLHSPAAAVSQPPPPPAAPSPSPSPGELVSARRRAQSKPWRRADIPPPSEGRFKQIARAKATPEYLLYIEKVKKEDRDQSDPVTPRVEGTTWREFQQDVRSWKRSLHRKAEALQSQQTA